MKWCVVLMGGWRLHFCRVTIPALTCVGLFVIRDQESLKIIGSYES